MALDAGFVEDIRFVAYIKALKFKGRDSLLLDVFES